MHGFRLFALSSVHDTVSSVTSPTIQFMQILSCSLTVKTINF
jgi:hypothetical protein